MRWISVNERLPKDFDRVLVFDKEIGFESIETVTYKQGFQSDYFSYINPSHWIELMHITIPKD